MRKNKVIIKRKSLKKYYCKNDGCNNEIHRDTWKYKSGTCRECGHERQSLKMMGKNNSSYKDGITLIKKSCLDCGKKIHYSNERCSSCYRKWSIGNNSTNYKDGRTLKIGNCLGCDKKIELYRNKSGLCKKCSNKFTGNLEKRIGKYNYSYKHGKYAGKRFCVDCGVGISKGATRCKVCSNKYRAGDENFKAKLSKAHKKIWETKDRVEWGKKFRGKNNPNYGNHKLAGKNNPAYIDGRSLEKYGLEFNKELKKNIRKRDNYICQNCGMTEVEHLYIRKRVLDVHHIDYIKKNNNKKNLISLCLHCHRLTQFRREYWTKYFKEKVYEHLEYL